MRFQFIIVAVFIATICLFKDVKALGVGPVGPPSFCPISSAIIAQEIAKVSTPDLPADLQQKLADISSNSDELCEKCESLIVWQSKICSINHLKSSLLQIQQIKAEADARLATTAPAEL
ncbi:uncharacterized protein LOC129916132 [Episyrphus balteatus]|uniref:uncharacterized protein LOC129916132 n=1 Tax=Episyrphus balteatus TaxID=286459 RepID=UPI0024861AA0|nr:uncharacterized protein LOC129916132 [Episyrphus balteatus]